MKLTKENIYINLRGKSEDELTELYNFLISVGEEVFRDNIEWFLEYSNLKRDYSHLSYRPYYDNWGNLNTHNKQEVTIQQLKEILQQEVNNIEVDFENVEVNHKSFFGITPDKVVQSVMNDLNDRSLKGIEKYSTTLERSDLNLKDWLQHAYEETLDKANYLKRAIIELDKNK